MESGRFEHVRIIDQKADNAVPVSSPCQPTAKKQRTLTSLELEWQYCTPKPKSTQQLRDCGTRVVSQKELKPQPAQELTPTRNARKEKKQKFRNNRKKNDLGSCESIEHSSSNSGSSSCIDGGVGMSDLSELGRLTERLRLSLRKHTVEVGNILHASPSSSSLSLSPSAFGPRCARCGVRPDIREVDTEFKCHGCTALNRECQMCDVWYVSSVEQRRCEAHRLSRCIKCRSNTLHKTSVKGKLACTLCSCIHVMCSQCNSVIPSDYLGTHHQPTITSSFKEWKCFGCKNNIDVQRRSKLLKRNAIT